MLELIEYIKLHELSIRQDCDKQFGHLEDLDEGQGLDFNFLQGQIEACEHLLSVALDIMNSTNERNING